ncbi:MAG: FAD-dependent monooxygenase, partial [Microbispora sp.]|nr:FAD-dependent monooxygenase [Microbispora sp.]
VPADPAASLHDHFGRLGWILPTVLARCPQPPELYYDQVTQVEAPRWSSGRVVLLGDSCQAVSLFAGHGASLAVAAAWVLAEELRAASSGDLSPALDRYAARMRPVVADVQEFGRSFLPWMAPSSRLRIMARDWILRLASLPGADRYFLKTFSPGGHRLIT